MFNKLKYVARTNTINLIAFFIIVVFLLIAIFSPLLVSYDPNTQMLTDRLAAPFWSDNSLKGHILGTDHLGRDLLSRIIYGSRVSLFVGVMAALLGGVIGTLVGLLAGYFKSLDNIFMRIADIQLGFPDILLALVIIAVVGGGLYNIILILGITGWVQYARVVRAEVLKIKTTDFVTAIVTIGGSAPRILLKHIFPNILSPVITIATFQVASAIIIESSLSFLGLGVPPDVPTWGSILNEGQLYIEDAWWLTVFPGVCLVLVILSINMLGDSLREIYNPKR